MEMSGYTRGIFWKLKSDTRMNTMRVCNILGAAHMHTNSSRIPILILYNLKKSSTLFSLLSKVLNISNSFSLMGSSFRQFTFCQLENPSLPPSLPCFLHSFLFACLSFFLQQYVSILHGYLVSSNGLATGHMVMTKQSWFLPS